ncbi:MAG: hypothetical protein ABMA64_03435 [Myxococcota bacterium]
MARTALVSLVAAGIGGVLALAVVGGAAHAEGNRVVCTQVPQKPGQLDEQYVANFMSEHLAQGRLHFTSITGVSTVICSW